MATRSASVSTIRVEGLRELLRITDELPKETRKAVRNEIRKAAVPIRDEAQRVFGDRAIWAGKKNYPPPRQGRYGISVRRTGTVAVEQRVKSKGKGPRKPKFVEKQVDDILFPTAVRHSRELDEAMVNVLERLQRKWVHG